MSQKIVITANMKGPAESTVPTTTYQWHWRRIIIAAGVVLLLLSAFYGLISSVNAEQNSIDDTANTVTNTEEHNGSSSEEPELYAEPAVKATPKLTSEIDTPVVELAQPKQSDLQQSKPMLNSTVVDEEPKSNVGSAQPAAVQVAESEPSTELVKEQTVDSQSAQPEKLAEQGGQEGFSQSAHVANVALGASIDTNKVSRAVLTREVQNREPVNVFQADVRLNDFTETLAFFSELKNLQGQRIQHVWYYQEQVVATIDLKVTTPRYRTYSNKNIMAEQVGHWRVDVLDEQGHLLAKKEFRILAN